MAISDKLTRATDSSTGRPVIAKLASGKAVGAATASLTVATNWTTVTPIYGAMYLLTAAGVKDPTTQIDWKAVLTGTTLNNFTITGGTDRAYTTDAYVEITITAAQLKDQYDMLTLQHAVDGKHANTITTDTVNENTTNNGVTIDGLSIKDGKVVTGASLSPVFTVNPYKFSVWGSTTTIIAAGIGGSYGAFTKISYQTELFDTGSNFDSTTNYRFTAPVAGFYQFLGQVELNVANGVVVQAQLLKNGVTLLHLTHQSFQNTGAANTTGVSINQLVQLTASDYVEVYARTSQTSSSNTTASQSSNFFNGYLLSAT